MVWVGHGTIDRLRTGPGRPCCGYQPDHIPGVVPPHCHYNPSRSSRPLKGWVGHSEIALRCRPPSMRYRHKTHLGVSLDPDTEGRDSPAGRLPSHIGRRRQVSRFFRSNAAFFFFPCFGAGGWDFLTPPPPLPREKFCCYRLPN